MQRSLLRLFLITLAPAVWGQSAQTRELAPGKFLVAARKLADPNFAESVILIVHYDTKGAMGLIVNRRTRVSLAKIFEDVKGASDLNDPLYFGGPVEPRGVFALTRSESNLKQATPVFSDIYLITSKTQLDKTVATQPDPRRFRAYMGYSGWGAGQLESEMASGAWYVFPATTSAVFDAAPASLWNRLIRLTEQQMAMSLLHFKPPQK